MLLGDVVDQLLDEHGLADAGAPEEARLAAPRIRLQQIDDLDAGLEHLDLGRLVLERGRRPVDRVRLLGVDGGALVHRLADDVEDAAERLLADGHRDRRTGVEHRHAAREPVGGGHGDGAHVRLAEMLGDLEGELRGVREDVLLLHALHEQRVVDGGQLARLELDVDDRADDLDDLPRALA